MKVDAIILSYKREKNLPAVIRGIRKQSMVRDIYLFHNAPSKKKISGVINICSEMNYGCIVRHAIGLLTDADYLLFVDDDMELNADFSSRFSQAVKMYPESIIGFYGASINPFDKSNNQYSNRIDFQYISFPIHVDIVKGRVILCKKKYLLNSLEWILKNENQTKELRFFAKRCDDIILNLSTQLKTKQPSIIIPVQKKEIIELPAPHGLESSKDHYFERDKTVSEFEKKGWRPLAFTEKYVQINSYGHLWEYLKYYLFVLITNYDSKHLRALLRRMVEVFSKKNNSYAIKNLKLNLFILLEKLDYVSFKRLLYEAYIIYDKISEIKKLPSNDFEYIRPVLDILFGKLDSLSFSILWNYISHIINKKSKLDFYIYQIAYYQCSINKKIESDKIYNYLIGQSDNLTAYILKKYNKKNIGKHLSIYQFAYFLRRIGKASKAFRIYRLLTRDPNTSDHLRGLSYFHLGDYLLKSGSKSSAIKNFKSCLIYVKEHLEAKKILMKLKTKNIGSNERFDWSLSIKLLSKLDGNSRSRKLKDLTFNILLRTSGRPGYYKKCLESVLRQTYKKFRIIVCYDDDETFDYVKHSNVHYSVRVNRIEIPSPRPFISDNVTGQRLYSPYNLYFNSMKQLCDPNGFIVFLDDDDNFIDHDALLRLYFNIKSKEDMLFWRVKFPNKLVPNDEFFGLKPACFQIASCGFSFHAKYWMDWDDYNLGDYRVASTLYNQISNKVYIDKALTGLQRNEANGLGMRDDL